MRAAGPTSSPWSALRSTPPATSSRTRTVRTRSWSRESRTSWPRTSAAGDDCREDGVCAVYDGVLVVAGGQATPLLEQVEGPLDDVSPLVGLSVELWRTPTAGATTLP